MITSTVTLDHYRALADHARAALRMIEKWWNCTRHQEAYRVKKWWNRPS